MVNIMVAFCLSLVFHIFLSRSIFQSQAYTSVDHVRDKFEHGCFPGDFLWGSATSAYQIEGGWNTDGKGASLWDFLTHSETFSQLFANQTGDIACDSYHKYKEDVKMLKELGVKSYRFSIAWSRILPQGTKDKINEKGIDYYNKVIDELLKNGIQPMVTLFHWDLPLIFRESGGWTNPQMVEYFKDYAEICFDQFGDRVKLWVTINEPSIIIRFMKEQQDPPASSRDQYLAAHHLILSHARAYQTYKENFKAKQNGKVSIAVVGPWAEPLTDSKADRDAADRYMQFYVGLFAEPIYGRGDYPDVVKRLVAEKSAAVGEPSRLPAFSENEKALVRGSADYFATNHYLTDLVRYKDFTNGTQTPQELDTDGNYEVSADPCWERTGFNWPVVPWGIRRYLKYISDHYGNPDIYVTENGCAVPGELEKTGCARLQDHFRVGFYRKYINEVYKAYKLDSVKVKGYYAWSLMDNFEWYKGYKMPFGLYYVDFSDPDRTRLPKLSANFYKKLVSDNGFLA